MRLRLGACILALAVAAIAAPSAQPAQEAETCYRGVYIISTKGAQEKGGPYGVGLIGLVNAIKAAIPGSVSHPTIYPHGLNLQDSSGNATTQIQHKVERYVASCPNSHIVLLGYSEGAMATANALCGGSALILPQNPPLNSKYAKNVLAAILYGDESRASGQTWNRGTCPNGGPFMRTNPAACDPFGAAMQDYCDSNDSICCLGGIGTAHSEYPKYNGASVAFILSRWRAAHGK